MKKILILLCLSFLVFAEDKKVMDKKIYSEKEVDLMIKEEVLKKIQRIRGKNITDLSSELFNKEEKLTLLKKDLEKRSEQLEINEKVLVKKVKEFENAQQKLLGCVDKNKKAEDNRLEHLVKVISVMKPAVAAQLLSVQEPSISVRLIEKIKPERVSKIFNLMNKEISARLQKQFLSMKR